MTPVAKQLVLTMVITSMLWVLGGCSESEKPVILGAVLVLTDSSGEKVVNGIDVVNGMEFAFGAISEQGGNKYQYELFMRDCEANPELAKQQYRELVAEGADVIITNYSHIVMALRSVATETKVPQLAIMATSENLTKGEEYTFRYWTQSSDQANALLPLVQKLQVKKLGLINIDNAYGNSVSDELIKKVSQIGVATQKVVYSSTTTDLDKAVDKLRGADTISFTCFPNASLEITAVLRARFPDANLIGPASIASPEFNGDSLLDGVYTVAPLIYNETGRMNHHFHEEFPKRYDVAVNPYSAMGYDSVMMLFNVIEQAGAESSAIQEYMDGGFIYPGLFGDIVATPESHHFPFPLSPSQMVNGQLEFTRR